MSYLYQKGKIDLMESVHNFRDFGGYPTQNGSKVKTGLLFRCASLAEASERDLKTIAALGIKTIIDLRTIKERKSNPDRVPNNFNIKLVHLPIKVKNHNESAFIWQLFSLLSGKGRKMDFQKAMMEIYREYVTNFRREFSEILRLVSQRSNLPILIHCVGGKDRTGFACSLIQLLLEVPLDLVLRDYLLTNDFLNEVKDRYRRKLKKYAFLGISMEKLLPLFEARKEFLEAALDQIENDYGTVQNFVRQGLAITQEEIFSIHHLLLEKVAGAGQV